MYFYLPLDFEVRKGRFGLLYRNFLIFLDAPVEVIGPITLDLDLKLMMFDVGITYDVGRWRLWDSPKAFELTLEPYFGVRIIHLPIDITVLGSEVDEDLGSQVPVLGLRAFIDLTKHWNLEFIGDYGGWGAHWNLQVGYRAMRLFELRQATTDLSMDVRGAQITFGVEF
jgi:hypothetical protein